MSLLDQLKAILPAARSGEELKQEGMAKVINNDADNYRDRFLIAARVIANKGQPFTSDVVVREIGPPPASVSKNIVGASMNMAAKLIGLKLIGYVKSNRATAHKRAIALWQKTLPEN